MSEHPTTERLNDLLDGLLDADQAARVRAHLDACPACREEHGALAAVVAELRDLPGRAVPPPDAWAGIAVRLGAGTSAGEPGADVVPFPGAPRMRRPRAVPLSYAAAAAVVLSIVSAGTVFVALSGGPSGAGDAVASSSSAPLPAASMAALAVGDYDEAVARLQDVVEQGRALLAPETLETLEASLRTIDGALADVNEALAADPSSELLARMLVSHQRSKLRLLRQAAISVQAAG